MNPHLKNWRRFKRPPILKQQFFAFDTSGYWPLLVPNRRLEGVLFNPHQNEINAMFWGCFYEVKPFFGTFLKIPLSGGYLKNEFGLNKGFLYTLISGAPSRNPHSFVAPLGNLKKP
jgi:hypothetical protein